MKVSPDMEQAILKRVAEDGGTINGDKPASWIEKPVRAKRVKKDFVKPNCKVLDHVPIFHIPVEVHSINTSNSSALRKRIGSIALQRRGVCNVLGKHLVALVPFSYAYHAGKPILIRMIRLGGRGFDSDNLQGAFKSIRDCCAGFIGANDNSPLILWEYGQEPGVEVGIRIEWELT